VVVDLIGLGLDLGAVVAELRPLARAALRSGVLTEFEAGARRIVPAAADRLMASLRRRLGLASEAAAAEAAAAGTSGAGKSLQEYVDAVRAERKAGDVGGSWDHANQPTGLPESQWRPGDPIDMPSSRGNYPPYDTARGRYWRNRANAEIEARASGGRSYQPGNTTDPVAGLTDQELANMRDTGRAPEYAYPNKAGQTWELEHSGVPQRVRDWLNEAVDATGKPAFTKDEARRLIKESDPGQLLEVTPLEHAFFDSEAHSFGRLRGDATGQTWPGTPAADVRGARPLAPMSDADLTNLANTAASRNVNWAATAGGQQLRNAVNAEIAARGLSVAPL
jgi:hypothetical protein